MDNPTWQEYLPEKVRKWDEVTNSDSPEKFWEQIENQRSLIGQSIRIPSENASDEDRAAFHEKLKDKVPGLMQRPDTNDSESMSNLYNTLGRPAKADEYKMPDFGDAKIDTESIKAFMPIAHELGLTQSQFEGVVGKGTKDNIAQLEAMVEARKKDSDALKDEWGMAYPERMTAAKSIAEKSGAPKAVLEAFENGTMDSATAKWLYSLSQSITPEGNNFSNDKSSDAKMTPEEAKRQINETLANTKHPYWNPADPGHNDAIKAYDKLYEYAYPDEVGKPVNFSGGTAGVGGLFGS